MTEETEFTAWLVEGRWGNDEVVYLAALGGGGHYFFGWVREPWRAMKFAEWSGAQDAVRLAGDHVRVVQNCKTLIAEHHFRGGRGANHDSGYVGRTGRTQ